MLAAAAAAQWDEPAPLELQDAWDCQQWNKLLEDGGLLDQPAGSVTRMNVVLNVYNAFASRADSNDIVDWTERNPRAWKIVAHIERMRFDNSS